MARRDPRTTLLLQVMDGAFDRHGWQGPTLRGALRGVSAKQALRRPGPGRHCVWDFVLHTAYWKYVVRRRLADDARGSFPRSPSNWPSVPRMPDEKQWRADVRLLVHEHQALRKVVEQMAPAMLDRWSPKKEWRNAEEIFGIAAHDLYHAGQISLTKRLTASKR